MKQDKEVRCGGAQGKPLHGGIGDGRCPGPEVGLMGLFVEEAAGGEQNELGGRRILDF